MMAASSTRPPEQAEDDTTKDEARSTGELLFGVLGDEDCRSILIATGEEARSASELSERCDLPLSTTYRKVERLTDAGLLSEGIRLRRSGKHTSEYVRCVDDVHVAIGGDGDFELTLERNESSAGSAAQMR